MKPSQIALSTHRADLREDAQKLQIKFTLRNQDIVLLYTYFLPEKKCILISDRRFTVNI